MIWERLVLMVFIEEYNRSQTSIFHLKTYCPKHTPALEKERMIYNES